MKAVFAIGSPYHKLPKLITVDAIALASTMFRDHEYAALVILESVLYTLKRDFVCWINMLHHGLIDEGTLYSIILNRKSKLGVSKLIGLGICPLITDQFANELCIMIYTTIISSGQLMFTTDNIQSVFYSIDKDL